MGCFARGLGLTAMLLAVSGCLDQSVTDRALQRMSEQPRYDVYEGSRFFRNRMAMQLPPDGTVPRDAVLDPGVATGRTPAGGYLAQVPVPVTAELMRLGRSRFQIYCAVCHGAAGDGQSVVASNMTERRPPPLRGTASSLSPGFLYEVIRNGLGRMPSYAAQLPVQQRWAVVAYVRDSLR